MFGSVETVSADDVLTRKQQAEKVHLIDVRTKDEVDSGKIPGALHIPLHELPERMSEIEKGKEYILICRSGNRSGKAAKLLKQNGFKVLNMSGGMMKWKGERE
ncbi:rhodanese-like domain-containing protein [Halobacillus amylolyticus]|uniref:Rhodanese-like domain-containing protein n=1 Tax=Halobacillus amylolyticus TaxID=2932259 RepID=A0ABY4HBK6_9BACI|nr:rhodanese-like domain-containing protein [Halobacillus amylolyticus]UOR12089.1 rhodanese-like domain-containing protein [Halobacillus amylolyticus]